MLCYHKSYDALYIYCVVKCHMLCRRMSFVSSLYLMLSMLSMLSMLLMLSKLLMFRVASHLFTGGFVGIGKLPAVFGWYIRYGIGIKWG